MKEKSVQPQRAVRARIFSFVEKNRLMTLATARGGKPWVATVFFVYDRALSLFFYSRPDTIHCRAIKKNPFVAVAINHDWKDKEGNIRGLQITGRARRVTAREYRGAYTRYRGRFSWADDFQKNHVLYRITPKEIWYIDEKLFGHFYRVRVK